MANMVAQMEVVSAGRSHVGMVRSTNQDYYGKLEPTDEAELAAKGRLYVVCDGMGGAAGGEVASQLAVETILSTYRGMPGGDILGALKWAVESANRAIWDRARAQPELTGMGTTCVALVLKGDTAIFAHDGDSRGFLIRQGTLIQLTKDHSMVQQMLDEGIIEESEVSTHPRKNMIMRCLGVKQEIEVELRTVQIQNRDTFFLCSDGLWGLVGSEEIRKIIVARLDNLEAAAQALLELADKNGGTDNSTVSLIRIASGGPPEQAGVFPEPAVLRATPPDSGPAAPAPAAPTAAPAAAAAPEASSGGGMPTWIYAVAGAVALLIIALVIWRVKHPR